MSYSRERDETCYRLCKLQASLFERSVKEGIPSYFFARSFFTSSYARKMDELTIFDDPIGEEEIYQAIKAKIKTRRGTIYPQAVMGWIGFLMREWVYRYKTYTTLIYAKVSLNYLYSVYPAYHSLDILKAIEKIASEKGIDLDETPEQRIRKILRKTMPVF